MVSAFPVDDCRHDPLLIDARRIETLRSDTEARARAFVARAMSDPAVTAVALIALMDGLQVQWLLDPEAVDMPTVFEALLALLRARD